MRCFAPRSRLGRPKDPAKHDAIVAAAVHLFSQHPFDVVTMEAVATQARVSKMTVYSHFSDKESLFETIVSSISDRMVAAFAAEGREGLSLRDRLQATGVAFLSILLRPDVMGLSQMLPTALRGRQALTLRFYDAGPGRVKAALAGLIDDAAKQGEIAIDDPILAAEDLFSLWEGGLRAENGCGLIGPITDAMIAQRVRRGTGVFLRAYAPETPSPGKLIPSAAPAAPASGSTRIARSD